MNSSPELLAAALVQSSGPILVVTGAGISLASGIPTFRGTDEGAIWKHNVTEMATCAFFERDPVESWRWSSTLFDSLEQARPNAGHIAIAELERWLAERSQLFTLVTQNIDTLHEQAGSTQLVKVHGSADRVRCSAFGCRLGAPRGSLAACRSALSRFLEAPGWPTLPLCPECEAPLRPHVLWFDEFYGDHDDYQWERTRTAAVTAELVVFVGTSFSVGVTDLVVQEAVGRSVPVFSIDPGSTPPPCRGIHTIAEPAEAYLPEVCTLLEIAR